MMKSEIKKIDGTKREVDIEVSGDIVKNKYEAAFKEIAKSAKVPGFRPGHAPRDVLEKNFLAQAEELVLKGLLPEVWSQTVERERLDVVDLPEISDVKLSRTSLSFKATVEVHPQISLEKYKGLKVGYKKIEVAAEDLKRHLESLKESRKLETLDDSFARSLGYFNLAELEAALKRQIFIQQENAQRQKIESQIIEELISGLDFKVPQSLVKRQLADLLRQAKLDLALKGQAREKIEEQEKELTQKLEPQARQQVKVYLVLAEVAKKENMPLDDQMPQRVMEFLLKEADWQEA